MGAVLVCLQWVEVGCDNPRVHPIGGIPAWHEAFYDVLRTCVMYHDVL